VVLDVNITTLIAGLGVGGIAVALAVQSILSDLFASLSILLDKPFAVGHFIVVDSIAGTVAHVGLKTTRVRSLSGEEIVLSNTDLLKSRIHNYKRLFERRVLFGFGVTYNTGYDALAAIPSVVREIVQSIPKTRFDRAHFKDYGDSSLNFEVVYFVLDSDYNVYMDVQQAINLEIYRRFEQARIEFAFPTRTLYVSTSGLTEARSPIESTAEHHQ
jgi:small-conductance mechanosensitive channel